MAEPRHACAAIGCTAQVPLRMLMCRQHWFTVPAAIRHDIWRHYRPGQEHDLDLTAAYRAAVKAAVVAVAASEARHRVDG